MSQNRLPPPELEACLVRLRPSSQKGGTIVAEDVTDAATHERRLCDPDGYRPLFCPRCLGSTLHVHDYRERVLRAEPGKPVAKIVRHECVTCEAIWQTLPAFIARHLWRTWRVVERTLTESSMDRPWCWPSIPDRTRRRWSARWRRPAQFLAQVLAVCGGATWATLASVVAPTATCADLTLNYASVQATAEGHLFSSVAALVYRLQPKVRLM
jgi:hypothetical protein